MKIDIQDTGLGGNDLTKEELKYLSKSFENIDQDKKGYIYGYDLSNLLESIVFFYIIINRV